MFKGVTLWFRHSLCQWRPSQSWRRWRWGWAGCGRCCSHASSSRTAARMRESTWIPQPEPAAAVACRRAGRWKTGGWLETVCRGMRGIKQWRCYNRGWKRKKEKEECDRLKKVIRPTPWINIVWYREAEPAVWPHSRAGEDEQSVRCKINKRLHLQLVVANLLSFDETGASWQLLNVEDEKKLKNRSHNTSIDLIPRPALHQYYWFLDQSVHP